VQRISPGEDRPRAQEPHEGISKLTIGRRMADEDLPALHRFLVFWDRIPGP
jgi:hypothetical protein